ncbi:MAG: hypothetical protein NZ952_07235 [Candidatus Bathyarchaeota archaeon]|nr:hypothetical protein [Candidatus Bathyarchaeota archaeon]
MKVTENHDLFTDFFPYEPYPQQLDFMRDAQRVLSSGGILIAEACNGFGKTACALSVALSLGRKIIYATRTHEQVRQVLQEVEEINKKTGEEFTGVALASRQILCLNKVCVRLPPVEAAEVCRSLRKGRRCPYKSEFSLYGLDIPIILSIKRLIKFGKSERLCPYFLARKISERCTVIVSPYQYVFNEAIRSSTKINMNGKILIFDEAHNADKIGQDALSDTLSERGLNNARRELERLGVSSFFINELIGYLSRSVSEEPQVKDGSELHQDLEDVLGGDIPKIVDSYQPMVDDIRDYKIRRGEPPICHLNGILSFLMLVQSSNKDSYAAIYRKSSSGINLIEYRCLDLSLAIKPVLDEVYATLIMSGTLSPLALFTEVLGLKEAETRTYSATMAKKNIRTFIDVGVTTRYAERNPEMLKLYGEHIFKILAEVPNGALIFFPQRKLMMDALQLWRENGFIKEWNGELYLNGKPIFIEGLRASENSKIVDEYKKRAKTREGAVLFAVFRGRNAEGSNFPYEEARAIFNIGLPYADYRDPLVRAQINYFNKKHPKLGDLWYIMDAFRASNQAMGRGIRHRDDWCHFFLMDRRYRQYWKFITSWALENGISELKIN